MRTTQKIRWAVLHCAGKLARAVAGGCLRFSKWCVSKQEILLAQVRSAA